MRLKDFFDSLFGSDSGSKSSRLKVMRPEKPSPAVCYVDLLLDDLSEGTEKSITIKKSTPPTVSRLGKWRDAKAPRFIDVRNRLKFLTGLNPLSCPEPTDRTFDCKLNSRPHVVNVHFDDKASDPCFTIEVRAIEERSVNDGERE